MHPDVDVKHMPMVAFLRFKVLHQLHFLSLVLAGMLARFSTCNIDPLKSEFSLGWVPGGFGREQIFGMLVLELV